MGGGLDSLGRRAGGDVAGEDQMISLPPRKVKMREVPTITLSWVKMEMLPRLR